MKMISNDLRSSCRSLLLGAYQGGGDTPKDEKWEYPSNWLELPEPAENQIVVLFDNKGGIYNGYTSYVAGFSSCVYDSTSESIIDWGDGTISPLSEADSGHTYEAGSGHNTGTSEQWIVTITFDNSLEIGTEHLVALYLYSSSTGTNVTNMQSLAAKVGNAGYLSNLSYYGNLEYIKFCNGDFTDFRFQHAVYLCKVELPNTVTKLTDRFFENCTSLIDVDLSNITEIGQYVFEGCYLFDPSGKMPNLITVNSYGFVYSGIRGTDFPNLKSVGSRAFLNCYSLTNVTLPENISMISDYTFYNCVYLVSINLSNATSIGANAFYGCYNLKKIESDKITSIGNNAFYNCYDLQNVNVPSCNSLGKNVFNYCRNLRSCTLQTGTDVSGKFGASLKVKITFKEATT